jgi:hypothetical protein
VLRLGMTKIEGMDGAASTTSSAGGVTKKPRTTASGMWRWRGRFITG